MEEISRLIACIRYGEDLLLKGYKEKNQSNVMAMLAGYYMKLNKLVEEMPECFWIQQIESKIN